MTLARQRLGASGEDMAEQWYRRHGYRVLARNWRCDEGELDLVLRKGRVVVFCEVKTRTSVAFGSPAEAVTHRKQVKLRHLAARWLQEQPRLRPGEIRFDVAAVLAGRLEVIEGAFW